jgi:hypothetical protein
VAEIPGPEQGRNDSPLEISSLRGIIGKPITTLKTKSGKHPQGAFRFSFYGSD